MLSLVVLQMTKCECRYRCRWQSVNVSGVAGDCKSVDVSLMTLPTIAGIQDVNIINFFAVVIAMAVYLCHSMVWCCAIVAPGRG